MNRPLLDLSKKIIAVNTANGWGVTTPQDWRESNYKIPAILALVHSEISEALEAFRKNDWKNFSEELADIVIRVLDCSGGLGIDLDTCVADKIEKNKARGYRHGGKRV